MRIHWTQPTQSGLCDRLNDVLLMATYARCKQSTVHFTWPVFQAKDIDIAHRRQDILIDNIRKFIIFPKEVQINDLSNCDGTFNLYVGGATAVSDFYNHLRDVCSFDVYMDHFNSICKEFQFTQPINEYLKTIPEKFMTFHIRRGDKVRAEKHDGTYIHENELEWLNEKTLRAIDYYIAEGNDAFFFCGDEDSKVAPFIEYARSRGKTVFALPELPKWQSTYYDIATMSKSSCNVTSQRYSSFARFPSFLGGGTFQTVFNLVNEGKI